MVHTPISIISFVAPAPVTFLVFLYSTVPILKLLLTAKLPKISKKMSNTSISMTIWLNIAIFETTGKNSVLERWRLK